MTAIAVFICLQARSSGMDELRAMTVGDEDMVRPDPSGVILMRGLRLPGLFQGMSLTSNYYCMRSM